MSVELDDTGYHEFRTASKRLTTVWMQICMDAIQAGPSSGDIENIRMDNLSAQTCAPTHFVAVRINLNWDAWRSESASSRADGTHAKAVGTKLLGRRAKPAVSGMQFASICFQQDLTRYRITPEDTVQIQPNGFQYSRKTNSLCHPREHSETQ